MSHWKEWLFFAGIVVVGSVVGAFSAFFYGRDGVLGDGPAWILWRTTDYAPWDDR